MIGSILCCWSRMRHRLNAAEAVSADMQATSKKIQEVRSEVDYGFPTNVAGRDR
jgi:hypothetical protein